MKNKLMLIFTAIALVLALVGCGKIETKEANKHDEIISQFIELKKLPSDTKCDLLFLGENENRTMTIMGQWQEKYLIVIDGGDEMIGYILYVSTYDDGKLQYLRIGEQVEIRIGTSKDLWGTDK